ncbi:hypothetical protein [Streptomyces sp. NPDC047043]|uniref:hypothetical protein n=1 Tax=Streptomyces sp. NPDC047043 TaxID=3154497 RepID=UPI0033F431B3
MTRSRSRVLVGALFAAGILVGAVGCTAYETPLEAQAPASPAAKASTGAVPAPRALTQEQAQAALITPGDLGEPWGATQGAATWRDGVLKANTDAPDCRRLLDALYTDDVFGKEARPRAVTGLDDPLDQAQLRYQVLGLDPADVDRTLAWMKTLPKKCGTFTAVTERGAVRSGQVTEAALPAIGDARQGLRVTLAGQTAGGEPTVLTLDVVVVRLGDDAITFTHGGLGEISADATSAVAQVGLSRLDGIEKQGRVQV